MAVLELSVTKTFENRALDVHSPEWRRLRQKILNRDANRCRFCEFIAEKQMVIDHISGDAADNTLENLGVNCQACDKIRHCGRAGMYKLLLLCEADLEQVQIVTQSRLFFKQHGRNPEPEEIDTTAKRTTISAVELANQLLKTDKPRKLIGNLKGFFTSAFSEWQLEWEQAASKQGSFFL